MSPGTVRPIVQKEHVDHFFHLARTIDLLKRSYQLDILDINFEKFLDNPTSGLEEIFKYLEIEIDKVYLEQCTKIVNNDPHETRFEVTWTETLKRRVEGEIIKYYVLKDYFF